LILETHNSRPKIITGPPIQRTEPTTTENQKYATALNVETEYKRKPIRGSEAMPAVLPSSPMTPHFVPNDNNRRKPIIHADPNRHNNPISSTTHHIHHHHQRPSDNFGSSHHRPMETFNSGVGNGGYAKIRDPLGKYENCRMVNQIVVCAESNSGKNLCVALSAKSKSHVL